MLKTTLCQLLCRWCQLRSFRAGEAVIWEATSRPAELILPLLKAVYAPGAQSIGMPDRSLAWVGAMCPDYPGTFWRLLVHSRGDGVGTDRPPWPKNACTHLTGFRIPLGDAPSPPKTLACTGGIALIPSRHQDALAWPPQTRVRAAVTLPCTPHAPPTASQLSRPHTGSPAV
jgi:hypothetical protein